MASHFVKVFRDRFRLVPSALLFAILAIGCGSEKPAEKVAPPPPPVNLATAGTITGTVTLFGKPPTLKPIDMSAEPQCVAANPKPVYFPRVVLGKKGRLANVVVYIKSGLGNYSYIMPKEPVALDQKGCMYEPHVLALRVNQPLEVDNEDPVLHNIRVAPRQNHAWNQSEDVGSPPFQEVFQHPELAIPIRCNVHPWMDAIAFVFDHPYFAVTTTSGSFQLKNIPPGTYSIEAWQEHFGTIDQTVTIAPNQSHVISFVYKSPAAGASKRPH